MGNRKSNTGIKSKIAQAKQTFYKNKNLFTANTIFTQEKWLQRMYGRYSKRKESKSKVLKYGAGEEH